jgi:hypothetical protein
MLAAILAQMFFFVRAHRRAGILSWTAAAIFTVLAVACNYTSLFFFAAEGLWLAYLLTVGRTRDTAIKLSVARPRLRSW